MSMYDTNILEKYMLILHSNINNTWKQRGIQNYKLPNRLKCCSIHQRTRGDNLWAGNGDARGVRFRGE